MKKNRIDVIFLDKIKVDKNFFKKIIERLIREKKIKKKIIVSLVIVNDKIIKDFNRIFRKKNETTTILSFPLVSSTDFITPQKDFFLGDIVINVRRIRKEHKNFREDLKKSLIHAFLHLLSYNHDKIINEKKMRKEEEKLLGALNDI